MGDPALARRFMGTVGVLAAGAVLLGCQSAVPATAPGQPTVTRPVPVVGAARTTRQAAIVEPRVAPAEADNIHFLAYLYGAEARGEALVREVDDHITRLQAVLGRHPSEQRPSAVILSGGQAVSVAGSGTTEDGVLELAGGRNAAAEAGIAGNRDIALEVLLDLHPDVVIVTEANPDRPSLLPRLRDHPVVGASPAFRDRRVFVVKSSLLSTRSPWSVIGAAQINRALYPGELS
jgi:ABC-type Fe3+-hydroxamate transport system substrate-binding protein